jgi:hypothetical protein
MVMNKPVIPYYVVYNKHSKEFVCAGRGTVVHCSIDENVIIYPNARDELDAYGKYVAREKEG